MLIEGSAPDPKCRLNISSFRTLPHLSDCRPCTRNFMSIVLLLQMLGGWDRWGWLIYNRGQLLSCWCFFSLELLSFVLSCLLSLCFK